MLKVINNHHHPITLESGIILAAAGTKGSVREVDSVTDRDRSRNAGRVNFIEIDEIEATGEAPLASTDADDLPAPTSIAGAIARDVVKASRADARKKAEGDKEETK